MIRRNPRGDLPQIHSSAFVDPTAILCGRVIVEENVFIGPYAVIRADVFIGFNSVLFNCTVAERCVVRYNAVVDGVHLPAGFYVPSTERIGPGTDLSTLPPVSTDASEFSEDIARTNNGLVLGYKAIQNEF